MNVQDMPILTALRLTFLPSTVTFVREPEADFRHRYPHRKEMVGQTVSDAG